MSKDWYDLPWPAQFEVSARGQNSGSMDSRFATDRPCCRHSCRRRRICHCRRDPAGDLRVPAWRRSRRVRRPDADRRVAARRARSHGAERVPAIQPAEEA